MTQSVCLHRLAATPKTRRDAGRNHNEPVIRFSRSHKLLFISPEVYLSVRLRFVLSSFAVLSCSLAAHASSLIGASVDVRYLYPRTSTTFQDFGTQTVTNGLTDTATEPQPFASLTFSANQITITNLAGGFTSTVFDGFDVTLLTGSPFTSVTYDPSSMAQFETGSVLSFSASDIRLNLEGTCSTCVGGEKIVLDVNPTTAVTPEPSSFALLGTGILGVVGVMRKRLA